MIISTAFAVVVSVGAVPHGRLNTAFQVIVLLPVASCFTVRIYVAQSTRLVGAAIVLFPHRVTLVTWF